MPSEKLTFAADEEVYDLGALYIRLPALHSLADTNGDNTAVPAIPAQEPLADEAMGLDAQALHVSGGFLAKCRIQP